MGCRKRHTTDVRSRSARPRELPGGLFHIMAQLRFYRAREARKSGARGDGLGSDAMSESVPIRVRIFELDRPLLQASEEIDLEVDCFITGDASLIDEEVADSSEIACNDRRIARRVAQAVDHKSDLRRLPSCDLNQVSQKRAD